MPTARSSCTRPTPRWWRSTPRPARKLERQERRSDQGRDQHRAPFVGEGQGHRRHLGRRVRRARPSSPPTTSRTASSAWRAYSTGPDDRDAGRPGEDHTLGKPIGKDCSLETWEGDQWKIGGGTTWGWYSYDPELEPDLLRHRQPLDLEPGAAAGPDDKRSTSGR